MPTKLVGILNLTPDSFSGDGAIDPQAVLASAQAMIYAGAHVLDVGAESTRPGATPLQPEEEWRRLKAVWGDLYALCKMHNVLLSLDTYHPETAARALEIGCDWINDVKGGTPEMLEVILPTNCRLVVMHSLSVPAKKAEAIAAHDVGEYMRSWCNQTRNRLEGEGLAPERLILDPGIGFGTSPAQSVELLANVVQWRPDAGQILIGHSRKSFLSAMTDSPASGRDESTRVISAMLAMQGADYLRVHDIAGHAAMLDSLHFRAHLC